MLCTEQPNKPADLNDTRQTKAKTCGCFRCGGGGFITHNVDMLVSWQSAGAGKRTACEVQ